MKPVQKNRRVHFRAAILRLACVLLPAVFALPAFPQRSSNVWQLLDQANREFDNGNLGVALRLAETAKEVRVRESTNNLAVLDAALTPLAVQNAGDEIPAVRSVLESRLESHAVAIIDEALLLHDADFFNNSISEIKAYYVNRSVYPEAEFLLGKIFQFEGEYEIARDFYFSALDHAYALDVPQEKFDIFYQVAYLAQLMGDDELYEVMLLNILNNNPFYTQGNGVSRYLMTAVEHAKTEDSASKFFLLYRASHPNSIDAAIQLAEFYYAKGHYERAYTMSTLAVLLTFTRAYEVMNDRSQRFAYTTLAQFFSDARKHSDIVAWLENNNCWQGFYTFALLSKQYGNEPLCAEVLSALEQFSTDEKIRYLAVSTGKNR